MDIENLKNKLWKLGQNSKYISKVRLGLICLITQSDHHFSVSYFGSVLQLFKVEWNGDKFRALQLHLTAHTGIKNQINKPVSKFGLKKQT